MLQKACWLYDHGHDAGEAANMAKYACAEAALRPRPGDPDPRRQRHGHRVRPRHPVGAAGCRTAPVSREMILNFVAQHSLGLPKSY